MADRSERLAIIVTAQDLASGKLGKVRSELAAMGTGGKLASLGLGGAMLAVNKGGQALSTFKSRLTSLAAPVAFLGLTGGLVSVVGVLEKGISKAADFGETVDKTMAITGLGVEKASALASALAYVGVNGDATIKSLGMAEKNLGNLTLTTKKATDFEKAYGLSLVDANGKAVDANELLLRSADYFNNDLIPASTKAAALSKIYGRSWTNNIEVFELGRKKLAAAEQTAKELGLTMTKDNVASFEKFRDASREASTALGGVELQLGLLEMPDFASGMKSFAEYVRTHQADIKQFFTGALDTAKQFGGFITGTVVPAISSIAGAAAGIWGSIPGPMKDLLVKGFVADRTMKFFFGMSPIHAVVSLAGGAIAKGLGGIFGGFLGRGSPVNPMFTKEVGLGGVGGALPGAGGVAAAAGAGALTTGLALTTAVVAPIAVGAAAMIIQGQIDQQASDLNAQTGAFAQNASNAELAKSIQGVRDQLAGMQFNTFDSKNKVIDVLNLMIAEQNRRTLAGPSVPAYAVTGEHGGATAEGGIFARAIAAGLHPTENAIAATLSRNNERIIFAFRGYRAGEREDLGKIVTAINKKDFTVRVLGAATGFGEHGGAGSTVPVTSSAPRGEHGGASHAAGLLGMTSGRTNLGFAGEAGRELIAVIRNPRAMQLGGSGAVFSPHITVQVNAAVSVRDVKLRTDTRGRYGVDRRIA
jgi:hypothetical protein